MTRQCQLSTEINLTRGKRAVVQVEEKSIALFNIEDTIYAIDDSCPHAGASLVSGKIEGRSIQCPAHGLCFDLKTGCMRYGASLAVNTYSVTLNDNTITITLPNLHATDTKK
jgi:3-phenylpropionate/trans-cinnamate dioxygenase ferredoxin subunit